MEYTEEDLKEIEAKQAEADQIDESSTLLNGYRPGIEAGYTPKGKLKPLGRWLGVSPAAKKMSKRLMRHAHATMSQAVIETEEVNSAKGAWVSRMKRHALIKQHNRDARKREKDLALAVTPEQTQARLKYFKECFDAEVAPKTEDVMKLPPIHGGPIHTYFGRVPLGGYLGVELRAIRAEKGC